MLALDADYRRRFGGQELRPAVARTLTPFAIAAAMAILSLALLLRLPR